MIIIFTALLSLLTDILQVLMQRQCPSSSLGRVLAGGDDQNELLYPSLLAFTSAACNKGVVNILD